MIIWRDWIGIVKRKKKIDIVVMVFINGDVWFLNDLWGDIV